MGASSSSGSFAAPAELDGYRRQSALVTDDGDARTSPLDVSEADWLDETVANCYDNFMRGHRQTSGAGACLGTRAAVADADTGRRRYEWLSYEEARAKADDFGRALRYYGLKPQAGLSEDFDVLGVYSVNCAEYTIATVACAAHAIPVCPLYDTLGQAALAHIVSDTRMRAVLCDTYARAAGLLRLRADNAGDMRSIGRLIVVRDGDDDKHKEEALSLAAAADVSLGSFADACAAGGEHECDAAPARADEVHTICYTSGTTGRPKGVVLTHRNVLSTPHAFKAGLRAQRCDPLPPGKVVVSFLPMAHIFEVVLQAYALYSGCAIGFYAGNMLNLMDDLKELQPTVMPVVPRLLGRLHDSIGAKVAASGALSRLVYRHAYDYKLARLAAGVVGKDTLADRIVFRKIQAELGGNVELMITGAAPISADVLTVCRVALGCVILEGYGQTECAAAGTMTYCGDGEAGHVGGPMPHNAVRLAECPELGYEGGQRGEVCMRGPNVMSGYYKMPDETKEAIDADGWLHTGDLAEWLPTGALRIVGRKKHVFKLAQGEYVAPEKIEAALAGLPLVAQVFVDGDSLERYLVAVVVPDLEAARRWRTNNPPAGADPEAAEAPPPYATVADACGDAELGRFVLDEIARHGRASGLNGVELPRAVHMCHEPFTVDNGLLTPTLKAKRADLREHFKHTIRQLYEENAELK